MLTIVAIGLSLAAGRAAAFDETPAQSATSFRVAALQPASSPAHPSAMRTPAEPFGLLTREAPESGVSVKWRSVEAGMRLDLQLVARCRAEPESCPSAAAQRFIAIVEAARAREGRARIGELNRAFNFSIRPASDTAQHGVLDLWSSPLATLGAGRGDCEDYAIMKFAALRELGFADEDVRLIIVRERGDRDHAVVSVRLEGRWLILDNRRLALVEDIHFRARPLFALGDGGVKIFSKPPLTVAERPQPVGAWSSAPLLM